MRLRACVSACSSRVLNTGWVDGLPRAESSIGMLAGARRSCNPFWKSSTHLYPLVAVLQLWILQPWSFPGGQAPHPPLAVRCCGRVVPCLGNHWRQARDLQPQRGRCQSTTFIKGHATCCCLLLRQFWRVTNRIEASGDIYCPSFVLDLFFFLLDNFIVCVLLSSSSFGVCCM